MEVFVSSLGFDPVLSEKGSIAYTPDQPLDESCYREVKACDLFVLVMGGRYGSEASNGKSDSKVVKTFFERYESITKLEYEAAVEEDIPIYILIEKAVYAEYQTFSKNRERDDVKYAHVESVNIFRFLDEILARPRNNPLQAFDKYEDIESWLRLQWAGLFRELIDQRSQQRQLAGLAAQVSELSEVNKTLRRYLEEVVSKVAPNKAVGLIESEEARLKEAQLLQAFSRNPYVRYLVRVDDVDLEKVLQALRDAESLESFVSALSSFGGARVANRARVAQRSRDALNDLNDARAILGRTPFQFKGTSPTDKAEITVAIPGPAKRKVKKKAQSAKRNK